MVCFVFVVHTRGLYTAQRTHAHRGSGKGSGAKTAAGMRRRVRFLNPIMPCNRIQFEHRHGPGPPWAPLSTVRRPHTPHTGRESGPTRAHASRESRARAHRTAQCGRRSCVCVALMPHSAQWLVRRVRRGLASMRDVYIVEFLEFRVTSSRVPSVYRAPRRVYTRTTSTNSRPI